MKMVRLWTVAGILLLIGVVVAARLAITDTSLDAKQEAAVATACARCHGSAPAFDHVSVVHSRHASFDCSGCHGTNGTLAVTDGLHTALKWAGVGVVALVLAVLVTNSFVLNKMGKGR